MNDSTRTTSAGSEPGSRGGIQVIARAAHILRALNESPGGMSLSQIAQAAGLPRSTVQRIVGALQDEGFVIAGARGVRLGPALAALAARARRDFADRCRQLLRELSERTGETSDLSVLRGSVMVFLDQVPGSHRLRTVSAVGESFPLTCTANGRACLALLPEAEALALAEAEWRRLGRPGDAGALAARLRTIRSGGLAYDIEEHTPGICAIGFGFADWAGDLHAISVPVPSTRFADVKPQVEAALRETRHRLQTIVSADVAGRVSSR